MKSISCFLLLLLLPAIVLAEQDWEFMSPERPPDPGFGHTLSKYAPDKILLFAGRSGQVLKNDLHRFTRNNPEVWNKIDVPGFSPPPRYDHAVWVFNGKMYVFGGMGSTQPLHDLWRYDPEGNIWEELLPGPIRPSPRYGHATEVTEDGSVYISGGIDAAGNRLIDLWIMNPDYTFTPLQSNIYHTSHHKIHKSGDTLFLLGNHGVTSRYSISTNTWEHEDIGPPLNGYFGSSVVRADDSNAGHATKRIHQKGVAEETSSTLRIYLFGGLTLDNQESDRVYVFNPSDRSWTELAERMPIPLHSSASVAINDNKILVFGGISGGLPVNATMLFSPAAASPPIPAITANGHGGMITITPSEALSVNIAMDPGSGSGQTADWWLIGDFPFGLYFFDLAQSWQPGLNLTWQGALFAFSDLAVLNATGLPEGTYTFYFGIDRTANGIMNVESLVYDVVQVKVRTTPSRESLNIE